MGFLGLNTGGNSKKGSKNNLISSLLWNWQYNKDLSPEQDMYALVNAYRGWIYICSNKNSASVASTPLRLYATLPDTKSKIRAFDTKEISVNRKKYLFDSPSLIQKSAFRRSKNVVEILDHPFLDLINNVNGFTNRFDLFETTELFQELTGNAFWYIVPDKLGKPQEIWILQTQNTRIVPHKTKFISGYEYQKGTSNTFYNEKDVVHFKLPNPISYYYGFPPSSSVSSESNIYQKMNTYEQALFQNMGRLDGAFETEQELSDHEFDRLKAELESSYYGVHNQGKAPLLSNGIKFKPFTYLPKDMGFLEGRDKVKEMICLTYGQSLGMYDREANRNNAEVAVTTYMRDTVRPKLTRIEEKINEKIMPRYDDRLFVAYDNPIPEDREQRLKEMEIHLRTGYSNVNMERAIDNLEPVSWGDQTYIPVNYMAFEMLEQALNGMTPQEQIDAVKTLNEVSDTISKKLDRTV